jgi:hypothetical protein
MIIFYDKEYNFFELFNENNGFLLRSNKLNNGIETNEPPFLRSFPELLDIGIMGSCHCATDKICKDCGIDCYQNEKKKKKDNMRIDDYNTIMTQARHGTFQIALGGAGDPNKHEKFEEILYLTREAHIVPNMTTSGFLITDRKSVV